MTDTSLRRSALPLVQLAPFYARMVSAPQETCRSISRSPQMRAQCESVRTTAASTYELPEPLVDLYWHLLKCVDSLLISSPALQCVGGEPVPLVDDDGMSRLNLHGTLTEVFVDICVALGINPRPALTNWTDSGPLGGSFVALDGDRYVLHSPDLANLSGLVRLTHEAGHWFYETHSGPHDPESVARYVESEACATLFCRAAVAKAIEYGCIVDAGPRLDTRWRAYQRAEDFLNAYFFLEEALTLGFPVPELPSMSYRHLRESRTMFFGYQVVYAGASALLQDDLAGVWCLLSPP